MADQSLRHDAENRRIICGMCMEWKSYDELAVTPDGVTWDFCRDCGQLEAAAHIFAVMAGRTVSYSG